MTAHLLDTKTEMSVIELPCKLIILLDWIWEIYHFTFLSSFNNCALDFLFVIQNSHYRLQHLMHKSREFQNVFLFVNTMINDFTVFAQAYNILTHGN